MNDNDVFEAMERLGIFVVPKKRGNGWIVTVPGEPGEREWVARYKNSAAVFSWLYSWAQAELPAYLALEYFKTILNSADSGLLEDLRRWFMENKGTERVVEISNEIYKIAADHKATFFHHEIDLVERVLAQRIDLPYWSLGQRLTMVFNDSFERRASHHGSSG